METKNTKNVNRLWQKLFSLLWHSVACCTLTDRDKWATNRLPTPQFSPNPVTKTLLTLTNQYWGKCKSLCKPGLVSGSESALDYLQQRPRLRVPEAQQCKSRSNPWKPKRQLTSRSAHLPSERRGHWAKDGSSKRNKAKNDREETGVELGYGLEVTAETISKETIWMRGWMIC